jgi:hypothetical protein
MGNLTVPQVLVTATLATTDPVEKYGGKALSETEIAEMANQIKQRGLSPSIEHDSTRRVATTVRQVWLSRSDRGTLELKAEFIIDEEAWTALGGRLGFSYEAIETTIVPEHVSNRLVAVYAEASEFDEATLQGAVQQFRDTLGDEISVAGGHIYQFAEVVPAKVAIEFLLTTLQALPASILDAAVYDVLKSWFLHPRRSSETAVKLRVISGTHETNLHIKTSDPMMLKTAVDGFRDVALSHPQNDHIVFDTKRSKWILPSGQVAKSRLPNANNARQDKRQPEHMRKETPAILHQRPPGRKRHPRGDARRDQKAT